MNKQYFLQNITEGHTIIRAENEDSSTTFIPMDEVCAEYQEYLAWVAEGNIAQEWQPE
jgi:hypothetical protein